MVLHEPEMHGVKLCKKCQQTKPVLHFAVCKHAKDGLHGDCRDCCLQRTADWKAKKRAKERTKYAVPKRASL